MRILVTFLFSSTPSAIAWWARSVLYENYFYLPDRWPRGKQWNVCCKRATTCCLYGLVCKPSNTSREGGLSTRG